MDLNHYLGGTKKLQNKIRIICFQKPKNMKMRRMVIWKTIRGFNDHSRASIHACNSTYTNVIIIIIIVVITIIIIINCIKFYSWTSWSVLLLGMFQLNPHGKTWLTQEQGPKYTEGSVKTILKSIFIFLSADTKQGK